MRKDELLDELERIKQMTCIWEPDRLLMLGETDRLLQRLIEKVRASEESPHP